MRKAWKHIITMLVLGNAGALAGLLVAAAATSRHTNGYMMTVGDASAYWTAGLLVGLICGLAVYVRGVSKKRFHWLLNE